MFLLSHVAMGKSILVTGGARSGKSAIAERLALGLGPHPIYIATAEAHDREMAERIAAHRARRGPEWTTRNAPLDLAAALRATDGAGPRLVDCLTLWLTNIMLSEQDWQAAARLLTDTLGRQEAPVILVTNEVGAGIVPENALGRAFRDAAGLLNQSVAEVSQEVYLAVAGIPMKVK
ncbi:bifunctional adenosylcobinamide kinase/adenosylcobinamide-phosphate guanylyltransferase [Algihabitans albus]|uniref:bifunctional adenosylcobinamide kinase/adenosylcobinamide-phosphate guanylyltransferase n=1 Tax=Algihabitans albus TaxID=2164067 RepID=UPI001F33929D|nr:bifunctional adenosylcobinamide kinase/adenosylcobinamide-phosphate guanylyltransferase [Algihabitans albus]